MQVYAGLDPSLPLRDVPAYARRVEALGFDGIHVAETLHDSFAVALLVAEHTSRLTIRTALTLAFPRSPMLTALAAWDLAVVSGGRFELGLGTQIKQNIEGRYGVPWTEPVARMRDYVGAVDACFSAFRSGGPLFYDSESYRLTRLQPFFNPGPDDAVGVPPIWLGGVNAGIVELAGEVAAGFVAHPTNSDPRYLDELALPHLDLGAARADRARPRVVVSPPIATGLTDADVALAREGQRRSLGFLYSTPAYRRTLELYGWADLGDALQRLTRDGAWADLPSRVTDEILDTLVISAPYAGLPALVHDRYGTRADGLTVHPPAEPDDDQAFAAVVRALQLVT